MIKPIDLIMGMQPTRRVERTYEGDMLIFVKPPEFTHLPEVVVKLTQAQYRKYRKWRKGEGVIQEMLPELSADEREMLMTGIGAIDFDRLAKDEE